MLITVWRDIRPVGSVPLGWSQLAKLSDKEQNSASQMIAHSCFRFIQVASHEVDPFIAGQNEAYARTTWADCL